MYRLSQAYNQNAAANSSGIINTVGLTISVCIVVAQVISIAGTCLFAPGYILPFFQNPLALALTIGLFVWELIGLFIACTPASTKVSILRWMLIIPVFVLPLTVVPMLGPAFLTISQALGPVVH